MRLSVLYEIFGRDVNLTRLFFAEKSMFTIAPDSMNRANVIVPASEGCMEVEYCMTQAPRVTDDDDDYEWDNDPILQSQAY